MPITVSYVVSGTSKRCKGMRLMLGAGLAAAEGACWAVTGPVKANAARTATVAHVDLCMCLLLDGKRPHCLEPVLSLSWSRANSPYAANELSRCVMAQHGQRLDQFT